MERQTGAGQCRVVRQLLRGRRLFVRVTVAEMSDVYRSEFPPGGLGPTSGAGRGEMYVERGMRVSAE